MYCSHCGKNLPDDAKFCSDCGKPLFFPALNKDYINKTETGRERCLRQVNSIARILIPKRLKAIFPNVNPIAVIASCLAVFVMVAAVIGVWIGGKHDLSGTYWTTEFFPISQIEFDKSGNFSAASSNYTETYEGKYRKQNNGQYLCRFTGGTSSNGNPVMEYDASHTDV